MSFRSPTIGLISCGLAVAFIISGCSSPQAEPSASPTPSTSPSITVIAQLKQSCASVYELDLLVSDYRAGAVANGDFTETEALADYRRMNLSILANVKGLTLGQASTLRTNSKKSAKVFAGVAKNATLGTLSKAKTRKLNNQRARMVKACQAAGFPLPSVNAQARLDVTSSASATTQ